MEIDMQPVNSSRISSWGYDEQTRTLRVEFAKDGAIFEYDGVPPEVWRSLETSPSAGSALYRLIDKGGYAYRRVG